MLRVPMLLSGWTLDPCGILEPLREELSMTEPSSFCGNDNDEQVMLNEILKPFSSFICLYPLLITANRGKNYPMSLPYFFPVLRYLGFVKDSSFLQI